MVKTSLNDEIRIERNNESGEDFLQTRGIVKSYSAELNDNKSNTSGVGSGEVYTDIVKESEEQTATLTIEPRTLAVLELLAENNAGIIENEVFVPEHSLYIKATEDNGTSKNLRLKDGKVTQVEISADIDNPLTVEIQAEYKGREELAGGIGQLGIDTTTKIINWNEVELSVDNNVIGLVQSFTLTIDKNVNTERELGSSEVKELIEGKNDISLDIDFLAKTDFLDLQENNTEGVEVKIENNNTGESIVLPGFVFTSSDYEGDEETEGALNNTATGFNKGSFTVTL